MDSAREVNTDEGTAIFALDRLVDVFFVMDIFFNFYTGFTTAGKMILEPRRIAREYLRTWFVLDVIASIPFDLLATAKVGDNRQAGSVGGPLVPSRSVTSSSVDAFAHELRSFVRSLRSVACFRTLVNGLARTHAHVVAQNAGSDIGGGIRERESVRMSR